MDLEGRLYIHTSYILQKYYILTNICKKSLPPWENKSLNHKQTNLLNWLIIFLFPN